MVQRISGILSPNQAGGPLFELQTALDLESFWRANIRLLQDAMPYHSCSLMLGIVDFQPSESWHQVNVPTESRVKPPASLSIAGPFLAAHPRRKLYTYSEIAREDPGAENRRREQEEHFAGWTQFAHLAFWSPSGVEAVLSIRRSEAQGDFSAEEMDFLARLHPLFEVGMRRLRALEVARARCVDLERFLAGLPLPVMFLEGDGQLGFATQEAYDLCAVWNHGYREARLLNPRRCFQVPAEIAAAWAQPAAGKGAAAAGCGIRRVQHPTIPQLSATVEACSPARGSAARSGCWVSFTSGQNPDGIGGDLKAEALSRLQLLTPSERRVALIVAQGQPNREVARRLAKSHRTVEFQLNMIYKKMAVSGRTELAHLLS